MNVASPNTLQKTFTSELVKWAMWALMALVGAGLVSVANRNVYSKEEVDDRDALLRREIQHTQEIQAVRDAQILQALSEMKADLKALKERP